MTKLLFTDYETDGRTEPRIIDAFMYKAVVGPKGKLQELERWGCMFNPGRPISPYCTWKVHHIADHHVAYKDPIDKHLAFMAAWHDWADYVVAHNYTTEQSLIQREFRRAGLQAPRVEWRCTMHMAGTLGLPRALEALCAHFDIRYPIKHRAMPDTLAMVAAWIAMKCKP